LNQSGLRIEISPHFCGCTLTVGLSLHRVLRAMRPKIGRLLLVLLLKSLAPFVIARPHRYAWHKMRPIVTAVAWSVCMCVCLSVCVCVCLSVCLLVSSVGCVKTAKLIKMSFKMCTRGGQRTVIMLGPGCPGGKEHLRGLYYGMPGFCPRSIFSALFATGQQRCGLWLPILYRLV